jgi:hypothetical protein
MNGLGDAVGIGERVGLLSRRLGGGDRVGSGSLVLYMIFWLMICSILTFRTLLIP